MAVRGLCKKAPRVTNALGLEPNKISQSEREKTDLPVHEADPGRRLESDEPLEREGKKANSWCDDASAAAAAAGDEEAQRMRAQLKFWQQLRQDLEKARLLSELTRKRERVKRDLFRIFAAETELRTQPLTVLLRRLLEAIQEKDRQGFFLHPVGENIAPDYQSIVKQPMNFSLMQEKVDSMAYSSVSELVVDFDLTLSNCFLYNQKSSVYCKAAIKLREEVAPIIKEFLEMEAYLGFCPKTGLFLEDIAAANDSSPAQTMNVAVTSADHSNTVSNATVMEPIESKKTAPFSPGSKQDSLQICRTTASTTNSLKALDSTAGEIATPVETNSNSLFHSSNSKSEPETPSPTRRSRRPTRASQLLMVSGANETEESANTSSKVAKNVSCNGTRNTVRLSNSPTTGATVGRVRRSAAAASCAVDALPSVSISSKLSSKPRSRRRQTNKLALSSRPGTKRRPSSGLPSSPSTGNSSSDSSSSHSSSQSSYNDSRPLAALRSKLVASAKLNQQRKLSSRRQSNDRLRRSRPAKQIRMSPESVPVSSEPSFPLDRQLGGLQSFTTVGGSSSSIQTGKAAYLQYAHLQPLLTSPEAPVATMPSNITGTSPNNGICSGIVTNPAAWCPPARVGVLSASASVCRLALGGSIGESEVPSPGGPAFTQYRSGSASAAFRHSASRPTNN
ncbi:unnamed protein product, partial [Protopolystoma xenopodis]